MFKGTQAEIANGIKKIVENSLKSGNIPEEVFDRVKNIKQLNKSNTNAEITANNAYLLADLISSIVIEGVFNEFNDSSYADLLTSTCDTVYEVSVSDDRYRGRRGRSNDEGGRKDSSKPADRISSSMAKFFSTFKTFLNNNGYPTRPSFGSFIRYKSAFIKKDLCELPEFETDMDAFNKYESWISRNR